MVYNNSQEFVAEIKNGDMVKTYTAPLANIEKWNKMKAVDAEKLEAGERYLKQLSVVFDMELSVVKEEFKNIGLYVMEAILRDYTEQSFDIKKARPQEIKK